MDQETSTKESSIVSNPPSALEHLRQPARVPPEIFVQIFLLSLPPLTVPQAPQKTALALVCRLWNAIVDSSPILCSGISMADSLTYVRKSLLKSGKHPIDVDGDRNTQHKPSSPGGCICCEFLQLVIPHAGRWRDVSLEVPKYPNFTLLVTNFPSLRSLYLYSKNEWPIDDFLPLFNGANTPHLRDVAVQATRIGSWDLISFPPGLSTLEVRDIFSVNPSVNRWLSILAPLSNLTVFRLYHVPSWSQEEKGDTQGHVNVPAVVELTALQELELSDVPVDYVRGFLNRLIIPEECIVSVTYFGPGSSPSTSFLTPALSHHRGSFQPGEVTITFVPHTFRVIFVRQRWRLELLLDGDDVRDALEWFGISTTENSNAFSGSETLQAGFTTSNSTPITLKLCKYDELSMVAFDSLGPVPNFRCLRRIETEGLSTHEHTALFWYLSGPEDPDQPSMWTDYYDSDPPRRKSRLRGFGRFHAIKNRSGDGATAGAPGMPARLKRIEFVDGNEPTERGDNYLGVDAHDAKQLVLEILDALDDDAELWWRGKRISKT